MTPEQAEAVADGLRREAVRVRGRNGETAPDRRPFTDPIRPDRATWLSLDGHAPPRPGQDQGPSPVVVHTGCGFLGDVVVELDAWYCGPCGATGRISGAWVLEQMAQWEAERTATPPGGVQG